MFTTFLQENADTMKLCGKSFGQALCHVPQIRTFGIRCLSKLDCFCVCDDCGKPMIENPSEMIMNETKIRIPAGGMYQEWMSLIDLVEEDTAKKLESLANSKGWRETQPEEALDMGFEELVNWSQLKTDALVLVADNYLVCLNKKDLSVN